MKKYLQLLIFTFITISTYANPIKFSTTHDGYEREYMVYLPKSYNETKESGLIICMHGFNSSMNTFFGNYNITDVADELNLVVVAPQALPEKDPQVIKEAENLEKLIGKSIPLDAVWGCGLRVKSDIYPIDVELNKDIDDSGFIKAITDKIKNDYSINHNIFLIGTSLGGFMSYQYAMYYGNELSGLISICGSMGTNIHNVNSDIKLPVCDFHSVTDEVVPYSGDLNYKLLFLNIKVSLCQSKSNVIDFWVNNNKVSSIPTIEQVAYYPSTNSITVEKEVYAGNQNEVIHYKIDGAYHEHYFKKENGDCMDYNEEITKFIKSHSIDDTGIQNIIKPLRIYPNPAKDNVNIGVNEGYVTIYNINGQQVFSASVASSQLDVSFLSKGIYIVNIQSAEGNYQGKLIIK